MFESISILVVALTSLILGLFVYTRNPNDTQNKAFALFAGIVCLWIASNYFSNHGSYGIKLFFNRFAYTAAMSSILGLLYFSLSFPVKSKIANSEKFLFYIAPLFFMASLTSLVVADFTERPNASVTDIETGPLYILYVAFIIVLFMSAVKNFRKSYRDADSLTRVRIRLMGWGIAISFLWVAITSAILPYFTGEWDISKLGPLGLVVMIGAIAYAIIRHKLFDIRIIVARSVAYFSLLFTAGLIFAGIIIIIPSNLIGVDSPSLARQAYYTFAAIMLAIGFQPLKRFFDKWTNRFFYQDAYDGQALIDELNRKLVSTIDLNKMLITSADVLERNIKVEYCAFVLKETLYEKQRVIGREDLSLSEADLQKVHESLLGKEQKVVVADYIEGKDRKLKSVMNKNNITVLVRLETGVGGDSIGFVALGAKKSGNVYNGQDIRVLEIVANSMVIAIQNALRFEEIQNFNIKLKREVEQATANLQRANEKLIKMDQTKDDFISMASHQLRTPLTSVKGYLSMVMEGDVGNLNEKQKRFLDQAFISGQRMAYLISDLLNISRLKSGKFVIENKVTNLAEVIVGEMHQLEETAKVRGLKFEYDKPKNFPDLYMDEMKIRQVMMNFMDNAIHYTKSGGRVDVILTDKGKSIEFLVKDSGIGVPKTVQHHLFTKFYRADNARKARPDGTGLGLYMAKKVVIAQGGSIIFNSQEGKGSTFGFVIPKSAVQIPARIKSEK